MEPGFGTYVLVSFLKNKHTLKIGRLGMCVFPPGYYVYIGSAFGPGGIDARVRRHLKRRKKAHWHIDYLRNHAEILEVWYSISDEKKECQWALSFLGMSGVNIPLVGFGASDCTCRTHLFHFVRKPKYASFQRQFGSEVKRLVC